MNGAGPRASAPEARDLPLQPRRQPWPPAQRRLAVLLGLVAAVLLLGYAAPPRRAPLQLILDGPEAQGRYLREARHLIDGARRSLWLAMYVVRRDDGLVGGLLDALAAAHARGVDVRVVLDRGRFNGAEDPKHVEALAWLRARGIHAIADEAEVTSHAKLLIADGRWLLAGSHNWTRSALIANREASWLVDDADLAAEAGRWLAAVPGFAGGSPP